ncbi:MAG: SDR family oxidoreductase [Candidatus Kariarchaeaceae archaeon]|jgi:NAD(P)-dependent dehydrogenase (short-subunit alcohol dehydrogenase family)
MYQKQDMIGKIVLITGASDGVGKQSALELAHLGAHVIMHGRNEEKTKNAIYEIIEQTGNDKVHMILADLSSFDQIRAMSDKIHESYDKIDVLINNAGVQMHTREITEDGYEMTFGVNHLAYFLLTSLLLDLVNKSDYRRVIIVASQLHSEKIDFDNLQAEKEFSLYPIYAQSKICNFLFGFKLAKILDHTGIAVNCLHPGLIDTNLNPKRVQEVVDRALPVTKGSISTIYLATALELQGVTGRYYLHDATEGRPNHAAYDQETQDKLWKLSEKMIGEEFRLL